MPPPVLIMRAIGKARDVGRWMQGSVLLRMLRSGSRWDQLLVSPGRKPGEVEDEEAMSGGRMWVAVGLDWFDCRPDMPILARLGCTAQDSTGWRLPKARFSGAGPKIRLSCFQKGHSVVPACKALHCRFRLCGARGHRRTSIGLYLSGKSN